MRALSVSRFRPSWPPARPCAEIFTELSISCIARAPVRQDPPVVLSRSGPQEAFDSECNPVVNDSRFGSAEGFEVVYGNRRVRPVQDLQWWLRFKRVLREGQITLLDPDLSKTGWANTYLGFSIL